MCSLSSGEAEEHRRRRVVFSIMRFLQDQLKSGSHSEDSVESLEGVQCVRVRV